MEQQHQKMLTVSLVHCHQFPKKDKIKTKCEHLKCVQFTQLKIMEGIKLWFQNANKESQHVLSVHVLANIIW